METKTPVLPKGKKVTLGDGRKGVVVRKEERVGFHGYIVKITDSEDESQIGTTVGATVPGLKWGQAQKGLATEVPVVSGVESADPQKTNERLKKLLEQQTRDKQQEAQNIQRQITMMQAVAQMAPTKPPQQQSLEQDLDQQEQLEEEEMDEQRALNMQNQMMQQSTQQMQQMNVGQQQMLTKQSFVHLAHPERANVEIRLDKVAILCDVAATPKQQATGLQVYDGLPRNRGLWFPQYSRRTASFHMGDVRFPIDIVFVDQNKVTKIVAGIQPRQMGSWSALCTDVIEVNGGWCADNDVSVGARVATPLTGKKQARSELERAINRSGPRIESQKTYDLLRTVTEASSDSDPILQQIEELIPELKKQAQEHYKVKPDTHREQPGEVDLRNPTDRFRHTDVPLIGGGEDGLYYSPINPKDESVTQYDNSHFDIQVGSDPLISPKEPIEKRDPTEGEMVTRPASKQAWGTPSDENKDYSMRESRGEQKPKYEAGEPVIVDIREPNPPYQHYQDYAKVVHDDGGEWISVQLEGAQAARQVSRQNVVGVQQPKLAQIQVNTPNTELAGVNTERLAKSSLRLYAQYQPEWGETKDPRGYNKMAVINDQLISNWISSLGFDNKHEAKLQKVMFTDEYKRLLGDSLVSARLVSDFDVFGNDLLLYKRD